MQPSKFLSAVTISRECEVTERTVRNWMREGELPVVRFGPRCVRVPREAYEEFVRGRRFNSVA